MQATLRRQPDYTCVQQIERSQRRLPNLRFELVDMLRMEVALVDGKELFAWPGSKKFEDTELRDMAPGGAIGNGNFALHARAVFLGNGPVFTFRGADRVNGKRAARFDYRVSLLNSGYLIRVNHREALVAYHGSFWADPETYDVLRLEVAVEGDEVPPSLGLARARDTMDYSRVRIGPGDFLLPSGSELAMVDLDGNESRNRVTFSSCRQYSGESVLSFNDPPPESAQTVAGAEMPPPGEVPGGLAADLGLETEIDSGTSMIGDPVEAVLESPLRHKRHLLIPRGATLAGRIIRLERRQDHTLLAIQFTEARAKSSRWKLMGRVSEIRSPGFAPPSGQFEGALVSQSRPQVGIIYIKGNRIHLHPAVRMTLRTENAAAISEPRAAPGQESQ